MVRSQVEPGFMDSNVNILTIAGESKTVATFAMLSSLNNAEEVEVLARKTKIAWWQGGRHITNQPRSDVNEKQRLENAVISSAARMVYGKDCALNFEFDKCTRPCVQVRSQVWKVLIYFFSLLYCSCFMLGILLSVCTALLCWSRSDARRWLLECHQINLLVLFALLKRQVLPVLVWIFSGGNRDFFLSFLSRTLSREHTTLDTLVFWEWIVFVAVQLCFVSVIVFVLVAISNLCLHFSGHPVKIITNCYNALKAKSSSEDQRVHEKKMEWLLKMNGVWNPHVSTIITEIIPKHLNEPNLRTDDSRDCRDKHYHMSVERIEIKSRSHWSVQNVALIARVDMDTASSETKYNQSKRMLRTLLGLLPCYIVCGIFVGLGLKVGDMLDISVGFDTEQWIGCEPTLWQLQLAKIINQLSMKLSGSCVFKGMMHSKNVEGDGPCWAKGAWAALLRKRPGQEYWAVFGEDAAFLEDDTSAKAQFSESVQKTQAVLCPVKEIPEHLRKAVEKIRSDQVLSNATLTVPENVLNGRRKDRIWVCGATKVLWANGTLWIVLPSHRGMPFLWWDNLTEDEVAYRVECAKCLKPMSMRNGPHLGKMNGHSLYHGIELLAHGYGWVTFTCCCSTEPTIENFVFPRDLGDEHDHYPLCLDYGKIRAATACHISQTGQKVGSLRGIVRGVMVHGSFAIA